MTKTKRPAQIIMTKYLARLIKTTKTTGNRLIPTLTTLSDKAQRLLRIQEYQQMHLQSTPLLSDIDADNFDHAFEMFHPGKYLSTFYCSIRR